MPRSTEKRLNFTKAELEALPLPLDGRTTYHDVGVDGLVLVIYPSGARTFHVYKRLPNSGKSVKPKIGKFPDMSIEIARKTALTILSEISLGRNPTDQKRADKEQLTLGALFDRFIDEHGKHHCVTWKAMSDGFNRYFGDWRNKKVSTISKSEVQLRVNEIGSSRGLHTANRAYDDLRASLSWAVKYGHLAGDNPCSGIVKFKTRSRERFIRPEEFDVFIEGLKKEKNSDFRDYVYLSLFTGARQGNVLSMHWKDIDFDLALWHIPLTKNKESQTIPLTPLALQVLQERFEKSQSEWVFPSSSKTGHLMEPKKAWAKFLRTTGLKDLRMHDLRRTLGSYMAMNNQSLQIIGKVLGHRSPAATQIYSRLAHDPLRKAMELAQGSMAQGSSILPTAKVVKLRKRKS